MKKVVFIVLVALFSTVVLADEPMVVSVKRLTMETALKIAQGTIEACRKKGIQVGVTVVDKSGHAQVVLRDVLAPDLTLDISYQKAYTAVSFATATSSLTRQASSALGGVDNLFFGAGGLPIQAGGQYLGAVGVSGAPGGETDEACAKAGLEPVVEDLEMSL